MNDAHQTLDERKDTEIFDQTVHLLWQVASSLVRSIPITDPSMLCWMVVIEAYKILDMVTRESTSSFPDITDQIQQLRQLSQVIDGRTLEWNPFSTDTCSNSLPSTTADATAATMTGSVRTALTWQLSLRLMNEVFDTSKRDAETRESQTVRARAVTYLYDHFERIHSTISTITVSGNTRTTESSSPAAQEEADEEEEEEDVSS